MQPRQPSRTAFAAAAHRAAHQVLDQGRIFADPLAIRILGGDAEQVIRDAEMDPHNRAMRFFIAARTRFAEDALDEAIQQGVTQLVVLGAGLDTYAYRSNVRDGFQVFEVDHPATQIWKRERLAEAGIPLPPSLVFASVDFEQETLADGLAAAGFDPLQQTFFTWLGVVPYLTEPAIWTTLRFIAGFKGGSHVVFDYSDPPSSLSPEMLARHERRAARVAKAGEAFLTYFHSEKLRNELMGLGFRKVEDLGPREIVAHYLPEHRGQAPDKGGHIVCASTS